MWVNMKYVAYDYEEPGEPDNYWHIYTLDVPGSERLDGGTILHLIGPNTPEMAGKIVAICRAIDDAVDAVNQSPQAETKP